MKRAFAAIAIAMLPIVAAAQRPPTLESQIKAELLNRSFSTKIPLGNVLVIEQQGRVLGRPGTQSAYETKTSNRLVDTNVFPTGGVLLNVRDSLFAAPAGNVSVTCDLNRRELWTGLFIDGRLCQVNAGRTVRVWRVDLNDDRLEVWLYAGPEEAYAKLKFMFGRGWQKTMNLQAVMEGVSAGLLIEPIERARSVAREYADLQQQLRALSPLSPSDSPDKRLEYARRLRDILSSVIKNRAEHEALGKGSAAQETSGYAERIRELDAVIPPLEVEVRKNRLDRIRIDLSRAESEAASLRSRLGSQPPKTLGELKSMEDLLSQWEANLRHREDLEQTLQPLGEQSTAAAIAARDREREEVRKRRTDLAALQPKLGLADLNAAYARMKSEENRLRAAYVAAFDTPRQRDAATQFRNHLQAMMANREAVQRLGEAGVAAEMQRLRTQLAGIR